MGNWGGGGWGMGGMGGMGGPGGGWRGELAASDSNLEKVFDWGLMKRLFRFVWPYKKRFAIGGGSLILLQELQAFRPAIEAGAINSIQNSETHKLYLYCGLYFATLLVGWLFQYMQVYMLSWVGQWAVYDIAGAMFKHIMRLALSFFDRNETGRIMSRVQNDVQVLQQFLGGQGLVGALGAFVELISILIIMFAFSWKLSLLTMVCLPVFVLILTVWQGFARRSFRQARATISVVNSSLQENVSGVRVIQSLGREDRNLRQFEDDNTANLDANLNAARVAAATQPMVEMISATSLALVIFFGGSMVLDGAMSIGVLYAFTRYINLFFQPIRELIQEYNQFQRATVAVERVVEILDTPIEIEDAPDAIELPSIEGHVNYDHVHFAYTEGVDVLPDFSLDVQAGERVAFVGQTGAGKSTIVSLLLRFYEVTNGRILIDGHDVRSVTQESLRRQVGVVLQDSVLFTGTLRDNIRYARPNATDAEVEAATEAVGADVLVAHLPDGYETEIQERGIGLSIGERQLISFARAMLADPRILILDEATANLDTATEQIVQLGIRKLTEGRTSLIIAHRLSTIRDADRIVVLEHGRIIEEGNHEYLIAKRGMYFRLYSLGFDESAKVVASEDVMTAEAANSTPGRPGGRPGGGRPGGGRPGGGPGRGGRPDGGGPPEPGPAGA